MTDAEAEDSGAPQQNPAWVNFYEAAWALRLVVIERMIEEGDHHPLRLIRRLRALERSNTLVHDAVTGETIYKTRAFTEGVGELTPIGKPAFVRSSLRGNFVVVPFHSAQTPLTDYIIDYIEKAGPFHAYPVDTYTH